MGTCKHGAEREAHKNWPDGLAFTEPLHPCSCCGTLFYYIETYAWFGGGIWYGTVHEPKDLCGCCGGEYIRKTWADEKPEEPKQPTLKERLAAYKERKRTADRVTE